ncbi:MAG: hypothetical protein AAFP81_17900 [Pseudomonadota bacterium]
MITVRISGHKAKSSITALVLAAAVSVSACETTGLSSFGLQAPDNEFQATAAERQRVRDAALVGCAVGAGAGILTAMIVGNNTGDKDIENSEIILGGIAGCGVGALIGSARGNYINAKSRDYADAQEAESALIQSLDEDIAYFESMNQLASQLIVEERDKITRLNADLETGAIAIEEYNTALATRERNLETMNAAIEDASQNIEQLSADIATLKEQDIQTASFEERLNQLLAQRDLMLAQKDELEGEYANVRQV